MTRLMIGLIILFGLNHCIFSLAADFNGDGRDDIAIFRPSTALWAIRGVTRSYFGSSSDSPVPGDYAGDGSADIGIFRGGSGLWAVQGVTRVYFGGSSDLPLNGVGRSLWIPSGSDIYYNTGDVAVGTSNWSGAPLTVAGNNTAPEPLLLLYEQGLGDYARLSFETGASDNSFTIAGMTETISSYARMYFDYNTLGGSTRHIMSLTGSGSVGIGKDDPDERMIVKMGGTTWEYPHFALEASDSTNKWDFTVGSSDRLYIGYNEDTKLYMWTDGSLFPDGGGHYDASTGNWVDGSSRALKQDIKPNEMAIDEILDKVDIVNYRYKKEAAADENAPYHIGFIAEDTPELLSGKERNGLVTGDCIGLLLAAVKEQQRTISSLEAKVASLEKRLK